MTTEKKEYADLTLPGFKATRLSDGKVEVVESTLSSEELPYLNDTLIPGLDRWGFIERNVTLRATEVVVIKVTGTNTEFVIPKPYADSLGEVRELRKMADRCVESLESETENQQTLQAVELVEEHEHGRRALPEDLVPFLNNLPVPSWVERVFLFDEPNVMDELYGRRSIAEAGSDFNFFRSIRFYGVERPEQAEISEHDRLRKHFHQMWWNLAQENLNYEFRTTLRHYYELLGEAVEWEAWESLFSWDERPTNLDYHDGELVSSMLMTEGYLEPEGSFFAGATYKNPIKTAIMSRFLSTYLKDLDQQTTNGNEHLSPVCQVLQKRIDYVNSNVVPRAMTSLMDAIQRQQGGYGGGPVRILIEIDREKGLVSLPPPVIDLSLAFAKMLTNQHIQQIAQLKDLRSLDLSNAEVTPDLLSGLAGTAIESLSLNSTPITDEVIDVILQMPQLRSVELTDTDLTRDGCNRLQRERPELKVAYYPRK